MVTHNKQDKTEESVLYNEDFGAHHCGIYCQTLFNGIKQTKYTSGI